MAATLLLSVAVSSLAQQAASAPESRMSIPNGYTAHYSVDTGGRITNLVGSGRMYNTLVNLWSGPRVLGESFKMDAAPGSKHGLVDNLSAFGSGFGGDPENFAKLDVSKSNIYEFSGIFRRDRKYMDYNLLGNPNIPGGQSIPIGPSTAPTGTFAWPQVLDSPFLFNTVRRMTDTNLTIRPLSTWTYRFGYSQNIMQGPSLSPSGYQFAGSYSVLLQEYQRNSTDDFFGALDWKPTRNTKLSFEEQIDHYKGNSYFTLDPAYLMVQEADGTPVALLASYFNLSPYTTSSCNTAARAGNPILTSPSAGNLPVIDPSCSVATSYLRTQPTRALLPTEIFRFQTSAIKNLSMDGNARYTQANMNVPAYTDVFNGLVAANPSSRNPNPVATRSIAYLANASAKRQVFAADYGFVWRVAPRFSVAEQIIFSNQHQPTTANFLSSTTVTTASGTPQTINSTTLTTTQAADGASTFAGSPAINTPQPDFFGQSFLTNNLTGTWYAGSRTSFSLTWRSSKHVIAEGFPHNVPLPVDDNGDGTVTIIENGGIFNAALHPTKNWDLNGTVEIAYSDNSFTPVAPRQLKRYRLHTIYKPAGWMTINGSFSDVERHNNTNNNAAAVALFNSTYDPTTGAGEGAPYEGQLDHIDYNRIVSVGAVITKEHYGFDFNYSYSRVYSATNICFDNGNQNGASTAGTYPGTATLTSSGAPNVCPYVFAGHPANPAILADWFARDFMDAPTQFGYAALMLSPAKTVKSDIGYSISSVNGSRFFNDARDVNGSLVSTYQSPYFDFAYTMRSNLTWKAQYNFYGYGEGGPSGPQLCSLFTSTTAPVASCASFASAGVTGVTGLTGPAWGQTAPRNFHANNVVLGIHYEF